MVTGFQILLLALGALSTIGGIFWETRKKTEAGSLTGWGKTAVIAAAVSLATAIGLQFYQAAQNEKARQEADKVTQEQLNEIRRTVYATSGTRGAFALVYPLATDGTSKYQRRMDGDAKKWQPGTHTITYAPGVFASRSDPGGKRLRSLTFWGTSPLAPMPSQELDEAITFDLSAVNIGIFVRDKEALRPGLELKLEADARRERLRENYNFASSEVTVWTDSQRIENSRNAAVRSVQDFIGARFVISVPHDTFQLSQRDRASYRGDNNAENLKAMWSRVRLSWVLLELTDWGSLCISERDMKREGQGMPPTYSVDLPGSMDELRKRHGDTSKCTVDY